VLLFGDPRVHAPPNPRYDDPRGAAAVVVEETAPWRKREIVVSIPAGTRFEIFECDSDNSVAHGVRIKSIDKGWFTVAEYVSREDAECLASDANSKLLGC
jgi:hypothetical protein